MKRWSLSLGSYFGTEVRIHATFLLLLLFFGWQAASYGGAGAAITMVAFILAMFTCVLLHEFGHVLAARRYGIKTPDITLLPIGGVARLERMPREPAQELIVAIAGPAVNVIIATLLFILRGLEPASAMELDLLHGSFTGRLMVWNLFMVAFNLIPAFPMDGGRVLRALLALFLSYGKATRIAASIGQGLAILAAMVALMNFGKNPMLLIIALFIFLSAGNEAAYVTDQESVQGLQVRDAMITDFRTLPHDARLADAVQLLLSGTQHDFPVLSMDGRLHGILTRKSLFKASAELKENAAERPAAEFAEPCEIMLDPTWSLADALDLLRTTNAPVLPVFGAGEQLIGLLTRENIAELIMIPSPILLAVLRCSQDSLQA